MQNSCVRVKRRRKMPIQKMMRGMILRKGKNDFYAPPAGQSYRWKHWVTEYDIKVCVVCKTAHGKIYAMDETVDAAPPLHFNCRCKICAMNSVIAGFGTKDGTDGADWWIKYNGRLPEYDISWEEMYARGYKPGKPPRKYAPDMMIYGGVYSNDNGHLPSAPGRVWYEADINYYEGQRNRHRIVWSNDGLIFVTYDHYETFYEII